MITEGLPTLKIHKLSQAQYNRELLAGRLDPTAIYMAEDEEADNNAEKLNYTNIAYGTCSSAAEDQIKIIDIQSNVNWKLLPGALIAIKFTTSNTASNVQINVNNTGAYPIWYNNAEYIDASTTYCGYANRVTLYMFNGTHYVWISNSYDANTTYTNVKLGHGYCTCSTAAGIKAKTASLSSYTLTTGGIVAVRFTNGNTIANPTLNINSKGAKSIYYNGAALTDTSLIKAGDTVTFIYSSQYHIIAINRDTTYSNATTTTAGLMSPSDKSNLDAAKTHADSAHAPSNAEKNQNAFSNIAVNGQTTIAADSTTDTLTLVAGTNINIFTNATNDTITIAAQTTDTDTGFTGLQFYKNSSNQSRAAEPSDPEVSSPFGTFLFQLSSDNFRDAIFTTNTPELLSFAYTGEGSSETREGVAININHDDTKQDKITGTSGQVVGFDENGNAIAENGVGKNVTGTQYTINGEAVIAGENAEIFNNYAKNKASGKYSHAEGSYTTASGNCSHSEGAYAIASGYSSHAEGDSTTASRDSAHAEGFNAEALGKYSHVEGAYTTANSKSQHVQGEYNILDIENATARGTYAHIVGNGSSSTRSNAHTLDWSGNAWFAGDVYVGSTSGTNKDAGSKKLATIDDITTLGSSSKLELIHEAAINGSSTSSNAFVQIGTLNLQGDLVIIGVKGTLKGHNLLLGNTSSKNIIMKNSNGTASSSYSDYRYFTLLRHNNGYIPITNLFTNDVSNVQVPATCPVCVQCTGFNDDNDPAYIVTFNGTIRVYGGSLI